MTLGFIGGTGLYDLPGLELADRTVTTRYGSVIVRQGVCDGVGVVFLARHGGGHQVPPHGINYRANIAALKQLGVTAVVASSAVGTLTERLPPGSLALLTDFIDLTEGRPRTFFIDTPVHLDFTEPYCPRLRAELLATAATRGIPLSDAAVYVCANGPRFETPAEIRAYRAWGAELVGMTNVPEVVLAREAEICYAAVAIACNWAAGLAGHPLTHGEVEAMMAARLRDLADLCRALLARWSEADCACRHALDEYRDRLSQPELTAPI